MKQKSAISTLCGKPLKLIDYFKYLGSIISPNESDVNIHLVKVIDHMEVWSIRQNITGFLSKCSCIHTTIWMHKMKKQDENHTKILCSLEPNLEATPHKASAVQPLTSHLINYSCKTNNTCRALLEKQGGRWTRGVMVKAMDCEIVVNEFELQSRYYVHFLTNTLGKGLNPLILPAMS